MCETKTLNQTLNTIPKINMSSSNTDSFRFNEEQIFHVIKDCLPDDLQNTQNLICVFDDILFAWNSKNACVLSLNWRLNRVKEPNSVAYQVSDTDIIIFSCVKYNIYIVIYITQYNI